MTITINWELKNLSVSQIDDLSSTFNWFPGDLTECDRESIENDGIRLPLLVQSVEDSKFRLIDGFKRLSWFKYVQGEAANEYQHEKLLCLIIPAFVSLRDLAKIRLHTLNLDHNSFSGVYFCRVLNMLSEAGFTKNEIAFQVFPIFGMVSSMRLAGQLLDLQKKLLASEKNSELLLPESIMNMVYEDLLPLLKFSISDFRFVMGLAVKMGIKGKKWRNLLQVLDEVTRLQETTAVEILHYPEIQKIMANSNIQGPVFYRLLKQQLESLRYPVLSKMRKKFDQKSKSLKLSERIILENDHYFEKDELFLKIKFNSVGELREHLINLSDLVNSDNQIKTWNDLFAILREK